MDLFWAEEWRKKPDSWPWIGNKSLYSKTVFLSDHAILKILSHFCPCLVHLATHSKITNPKFRDKKNFLFVCIVAACLRFHFPFAFVSSNVQCLLYLASCYPVPSPTTSTQKTIYFVKKKRKKDIWECIFV